MVMRPAARAILHALVLATLLGAASLVAAEEGPSTGSDREPRKIGLEERAGRRLAQLDITVIGPAEVVSGLTAEDFRIKINLRKLPEFELDRLCTPQDPAPDAKRASEVADQASQVRGPTASYLFYFDQPFLTMQGRLRSLEVARTLIDRLITDTSRGMIVSNSAETRIFQQLTSDRELLKSKLREIEIDRTQWDMYAELEDARVRDVVEALNWTSDIAGGADLNAAISRARVYQKEERWFTDRNLRRLAITLGQLVDLESPKALISTSAIRSGPTRASTI